MRHFLVMMFACLLVACQSAKTIEASNEFVGAARMDTDGVIILQLRVQTDEPGDEAAVGDAVLRIPPSDKRYNDILKHLGGLKVGEEKLVPAWPARKK